MQLLGSLLDDVLKSEVGTELFNKVERIRSLAQCAAQLANKHDSVRHTKLPTLGAAGQLVGAMLAAIRGETAALWEQGHHWLEQRSLLQGGACSCSSRLA